MNRGQLTSEDNKSSQHDNSTLQRILPPPSELLYAELDSLLDEIDEVLEGNAEEFVKSYIQAGGNGGGEYTALFETWSEALGPERTEELLALLAQQEEYDEGSWGYSLIHARYGDAAARYFLEAVNELPALRRHAGEWDSYDEDPSALAARQQHYDRLIERLRGELEVRRLAMSGDYLSARRELTTLVKTDPPSLAFLAEEFKYFVAGDSADLGTPGSAACQVSELIQSLKTLVAPTTHTQPVGVEEVAIESSVLSDTTQQSERRDRPISTVTPRNPQGRGEALEAATIRLFQRVFEIAKPDTETLLERLRRQHAGSQQGHDIQLNVAFDATAANNRLSRCRVECKNYTSHITLGDIADKLLQQEQAAIGAPIDHWVLISPHTDPTNELQQLLDVWAEDQRFSFSVQIWSPANGVKRLFSLVLNQAQDPGRGRGTLACRGFRRWRHNVAAGFR